MTDAVKMAIEALRTLIPGVPRLGERDDYADDFLLSIKVTSGELRAARNTLAALEQAGEPVTGIGHGEEADYAELKRLYNFSDDDSAQFTRWNMLTAIRHGKRLGQEFDAGEAKPVAYRFVHLDYAGRKVSRYGAQPERVNGHDPIETHPLYAHPPQSRGQAFDGEGEAAALRIGWWNDMRRRGVSQENAILAINAALSSAKRG